MLVSLSLTTHILPVFQWAFGEYAEGAGVIEEQWKRPLKNMGLCMRFAVSVMQHWHQYFGIHKSFGTGPNKLHSLDMIIPKIGGERVGTRIQFSKKRKSFIFPPSWESGISFVLNLVFITRYMRPGGPWQRLCRCPLEGNGGLF